MQAAFPYVLLGSFKITGSLSSIPIYSALIFVANFLALVSYMVTADSATRKLIPLSYSGQSPGVPPYRSSSNQPSSALPQLARSPPVSAFEPSPSTSSSSVLLSLVQ